MYNYLLSIIIPTRNRAYFANKSIRQVLSLCPENVQVVVQDNSDGFELKELLSDIIKLPNFKYHYSSEALSFVDNFDLALSLSQGEYVIMIGDDDGITSELMEIVSWAKSLEIKALKPNLSVVYFWPNSGVFAKESDNGILKISRSKGNLKWLDPKDGVRNLLKNGCQEYLNQDLIKVYHGIVHRDLLLKVKDKIGKFVGGLSPDIYLSVALSLVSDSKLLSVDIPLTISGICRASGSSASATGEHTGKLEDAPHFKGNSNYIWNNKVPRFYSVETIWADSALAAVKDISPDLENTFSSYNLIGITLRKYPQYSQIIWENYEENKGNLFFYYCWKIKYILGRIKRAIMYRLIKKINYRWDSITDIENASKTTELFLVSTYKAFRCYYK